MELRFGQLAIPDAGKDAAWLRHRLRKENSADLRLNPQPALQGIYLRLNRTGDGQAIGRVSRHGLGRGFRRWDHLRLEIDEKLFDSLQRCGSKPSFPVRIRLQLDHYRLG